MPANRDRPRIDVLLVERGLCPSRQRAQALIMAGRVLVDDRPVDKPGTRVAAGARLRLRGVDHPYVSRGGVKLAGALDDLDVAVAGLVALDAGASTGGFTDCLLQRGAARVHAVDVGRGQLHEKLRRDGRVIVHDRTNLRHLEPAALGEAVDLATLDLSFISLRLVLGPVAALLRPGGRILALVKPQFELEREKVGKGGIVRDDGLRRQALERVAGHARGLGLRELGRADSRLSGADGNREMFLLLEKSAG
ncbi:MAG: TlyA family rRNA (cytidine-2'-O)-methyltransferase [Deltaproteobacteria bacterium]|nr:MAG: TlyA family rRNA (cytidine-2'-O)-methyltransferase [Deltaproteobacteria bacterium]